MALILVLACILHALFQIVCTEVTTCKSRNVTIKTNCKVYDSFNVPFAILSVEPEVIKCDTLTTVCATSGNLKSYIKFNGSIPTTLTSISLTASDGTLAVPSFIHRAIGEASTMPLELQFPVSGIISSTSVIIITTTFTTPTIADISNVLESTASGTACNNKLCFLVSGKEVYFWGKKMNANKIRITDGSTGFVDLPQTILVVNQVPTDPLAFEIPVNNIISAKNALTITVTFEVKTIVGNVDVLVPVDKCVIGKACYEKQVESTATIKGILPSDPMQFTFKGSVDEEFLGIRLESSAWTYNANGLLLAVALIVNQMLMH